MKPMRTGWYGAAEKAETFFFEHEWVPVPGHPVQVATCDVCGLNRWSDEHMSLAAKYADPGYLQDGTRRYPIDSADHVRAAWACINQPGDAVRYQPADRERIKARIRSAAERLGVDVVAEAAAQHARLEKSYGPKPTTPHAHAPEMIAPAPPPHPAPLDARDARAVEDQAIAASCKAPAAQNPHPFMPAQYPLEDGQPRCRLCGEGTPCHANFQPEVPVAASQAATPAEVRERPVVTEGHAPEVVQEKAFVTEVNGKTLITGRASAFTLEKAVAGNEHMLWLSGRFVGAEKANRNGALWTVGDLEMGQASVNHGPLNWLHEARHVIGTIASADLVHRNEQADEALDQPYIQASSAIWRWLYPDEAWVVEQASDAGKLWYSMECISKHVECVGDGSCATKASYTDYLQNKGCEHMTQRSAVRRFEDPTFLGGAVIVPPVRPGWAEADARVMRQAASLAEQAFDQAGQPDVAASEWEQLMASLVRFSAA